VEFHEQWRCARNIQAAGEAGKIVVSRQLANRRHTG
jgi:hypothetical protein